MVYSQPSGDRALDRTFAALADPTRRAILARLATGDAAISDLAHPFAMSLPAVSKHLRVLERAGLATIRRDGRVRRCRLTADPLRGAARWVERYRRFWDAQLDQLARYLGESTAPEDHASWPPPRTPRPRSASKSAASSTRRPSGSSKRGRRPKT
jgi:DNA-binding transcriptional ArsR family regulator